MKTKSSSVVVCVVIGLSVVSEPPLMDKYIKHEEAIMNNKSSYFRVKLKRINFGL